MYAEITPLTMPVTKVKLVIHKMSLLYHPLFLARVSIRLTEHHCSDVTQPPNHPSSQNETLDAACIYNSTKYPIYCQIKIVMTKTIIG